MKLGIIEVAGQEVPSQAMIHIPQEGALYNQN
jgi:hypothetical protein